MPMKHLPCFILFFLIAPVGGSEDAESLAEVDEGHSYHGEIFNEGPRQAAVKIPGCGHVHFPVTTSSAEAQEYFDQGIGQLHGYWDFEAERSFRQVALIDPECAMTYWGMAIANFKNTKRAKGFIDEAVKRRGNTNDKEKLWIDSLAAYFNGSGDDKTRRRKLTDAWKQITIKYPDDVEAKAFYMRQMYKNSRKGVRLESHDAMQAIADEIFKTHPDHPTHHYVIHLWDYKKPANSLDSAEKCGPSAPAIAHMWHMPGHTYSKLHRYSEAAWYQEASARVDHAHTMKYGFFPDQIHNFAHNNEWLVKNLYYLGRSRDAIDLAKNMVELPRVPKFKKEGDDSSYDPNKSSWLRGRKRLRESLIILEQWKELLELVETPYLKADGRGIKQDDLDKFCAIARFETGDIEGGREMKKKVKKESLLREVSVYEALNSNPPDLATAKSLLPKLTNIAKSRHAYLWSRAGNHEQAVKLAQQAVNSGRNQVQPLAIKVQVLHSAGKVEEAKTAFESLRKIAGQADADLPCLRRLKTIASEFGYSDDNDWRIHPKIPSHGDLDNLGPFRWTPAMAPHFALRNSEGKEFTLAERAGKNTLLIFFLGKGCAHCMEQLNDFAPAMEKYREKGIDIIAVSSDTPAGLAETFATTGDENGKSPFPFPLVSDSELAIFKKYRAFDTFENQTLHGTFLIDGNLRIRWQDISYEPFMYPDWLLGECERLLKVDVPSS